MSTIALFNALIDQNSSDLSNLDNFDLDSADPASVEAFKALEQAYREDAKALVDFVAANSAAILAALS